MGPNPVRAKVRSRVKGYQFTIIYSNGTEKYFTKQCNESVALQILDKIKNRIALNTFDLKDFTQGIEKSIPFKTFGNLYLKHRKDLIPSGGLSQATWDKDFYSFSLFAKFIGKGILINSITVNHAIEFINRLIPNYSPSSINGYIKHLRAGFSWGVDNGFLKTNIFKSKELPKLKQNNQIRIFTKNEINKVREYGKTLPTRWKLDVFNLSLNTGLRRIEIFRLKKNDLKLTNLGNNKPVYMLRLHRKGNKFQSIPIKESVSNLLLDRISILDDKEKINRILLASKQSKNPLCHQRIKEGYLFFEISTVHAITREIRELLDHLDIKANFHDLRKTYSTRMIESGASLETVSQLNGHSDIRTTQKFYAEITHAKIIKEIEKIPDI